MRTHRTFGAHVAGRATLGAAALLAFSGLGIFLPSTAQAAAATVAISTSTTATTPSALAEMLIGPGATLDAGTPATVNGATAFVAGAQNHRSYGSFTNGTADVGIDSGLVIGANSDVSRIPGSTVAAGGSTPAWRIGTNVNDPTLDALLGLKTAGGLCNSFPCTQNATDLEFGVEAAGDFIKFEYVLAITEVGNYVGPEWNTTSNVFRYPDGFGLFVNGVNAADNCAVVPSTSQYLTMESAKIVPPTGSGSSNRAAALATVSPNQRYAYAAENPDWWMQFLTVPLTCVVDVSAEHTAGTPVTIRIVVADANDNAVPPAVFLKGDSIRFEATSTPTPPAAPTWVDETIGSFVTGVAVTDGVSAEGFPWPTYSITTGVLPAGLALNTSTGAITGTPTTAGAYSFTITGSNGVGPAATKLFTGSVTSPPTWVDDTIGVLEAGVPLVDGVSVTSAPASTYSISAGTLPAGLSLNTSTGAITGTPTTAGAYDFTITASNGVGAAVTKRLMGNVTTAPIWVDDTIGAVQVGVAFVDGILVSGVPAATYQVSAGTLPAGLSLNTSTGAITGTPTTAGAYDFTITASNGVGASATKRLTGAVAPAGGGGGVVVPVVVSPVRVIDTRSSAVQFPAGSVTRIVVTDMANVPDDTTSVVLNVTVTNPQEAGFITVYPCGSEVPQVSSINFGPGETVANSVTVSPNEAGEICVFSSATTDLLVDMNWVHSASANTGHLTALDPSRLVDTRERGGKLVSGEVFELPVAGHGIPANATAVLLNVTVTEPDTDGYLTAFACDAARPSTSTVNFLAGVSVPNSAVVALSATGTVCFLSTATAHLVVDVNGAFTPTPAGSPVRMQPERLLDTRQSGVELAADVPQVVDLGMFAAFVDGSTAVTLNVTIVDPQGDGFATVYACEAGLPLASNVNFTTGATVANSATVPIGSDMLVCIRSTRTAHLVVDLYAVYVADSQFG